MSHHHGKNHHHRSGHRSHHHGHHHGCGCQECFVAPPRLGACCMDGICSIQEEGMCLAYGGLFKGVNTRCWEVKCPGAENSIAGACCFGLGRCTIANGRTCDSMGGVFQGPYSTCDACSPNTQNIYGPNLISTIPPFAVPSVPAWPSLPVWQNPAYLSGIAQAPYSCGFPNGGRPCNNNDNNNNNITPVVFGIGPTTANPGYSTGTFASQDIDVNFPGYYIVPASAPTCFYPNL